MKPYRPFRFRQFAVADDRCAMKVGTDGVLLGAWCRVQGKQNALDIGTGSGLIALMLAQRNPLLQVTAIELDAEAAGQAAENVANSPWRNRIQVSRAALQEFRPAEETRYDLIVCNPPFFPEGGHLPAAGTARRQSRSDATLSSRELFMHAAMVLSDAGTVSLVLPESRNQEFQESARLAGWYPERETLVRPMPEKPAHRVLLEFGRVERTPEYGEITLQLSGRRHDYSPEFIALTREFYTLWETA